MHERVGETMAAYDALAGDFAERHGVTPPDLAAFRAAFVERLPRAARVGDLGCGPGHDSRALAAAGLTVVGVDLSAGMLLQAASRGAHLVRADIRRPPIRDGALDGLWAVASLLHVPAGDLGPTLLAWRQLLRIGGVLAFTTSLGAHEGWERDGAHRRWFVHRDRDDLVAAVLAARFALVAVEEGRSHRHWLRVMAAAA